MKKRYGIKLLSIILVLLTAALFTLTACSTATTDEKPGETPVQRQPMKNRVKLWMLLLKQHQNILTGFRKIWISTEKL